MLRACLAFLCTGTVYLLTVTSPNSSTTDVVAACPAPDAARPPAVSDRSCKPFGPVDVLLEQAQTSVGSRVDLEWSIVPEREMRSLSWELELPRDGSWLEGERAGKALAVHRRLPIGTRLHHERSGHAQGRPYHDVHAQRRRLHHGKHRQDAQRAL